MLQGTQASRHSMRSRGAGFALRPHYSRGPPFPPTRPLTRPACWPACEHHGRRCWGRGRRPAWRARRRRPLAAITGAPHPCLHSGQGGWGGVGGGNPLPLQPNRQVPAVPPHNIQTSQLYSCFSQPATLNPCSPLLGVLHSPPPPPPNPPSYRRRDITSDNMSCTQLIWKVNQ
jgi:hypothetical protein